MKRKRRLCRGKCPNCGSENIDWRDSELHNDFALYEGMCSDCETEFTEEYGLQYKVTVITHEGKK